MIKRLMEKRKNARPTQLESELILYSLQLKMIRLKELKRRWEILS